jgi:hypothetical protein
MWWHVWRSCLRCDEGYDLEDHGESALQYGDQYVVSSDHPLVVACLQRHYGRSVTIRHASTCRVLFGLLGVLRGVFRVEQNA